MDKKDRKDGKFVQVDGNIIFATNDELKKAQDKLKGFYDAVESIRSSKSDKKRHNPGKDKLLGYVKNGTSIKNIASECSVTAPTVQRWLRSYQISYKKSKYPGEETLREDLESMPRQRIAEKYGVSVDTIRAWIRKYHVQYTPNPEILRKNPGKEKLEEYLKKENGDIQVIADRFHVLPKTVRKWIRDDDIPVAGVNPYTACESRYPGDEVFRQECSELTEGQIASKEHVDKKTVYRWMQKHGMQCCRKESRYPGNEAFQEACSRETASQLAETYGVKEITIQNWMQKTGIHCQYDQGAYPGDRQFLEDLRTMKMRDIAKKYNRTLDRIKKWRRRLRDDLKRHGITIDQAKNGDVSPEELNRVLDEIAKERYETHRTNELQGIRKAKRADEHVPS